MKKVLITGANRGIGLELAGRLAEQSHAVVATFRDPARSLELLHLAQVNEHLIAVQAEVTEEADRNSLAQQIEREFGSIDWVIHNAGIAGWGGLQEETQERMMEVFKVNAVAPVMLTKALLPLLKKGQDPKVWIISSKLGSIGSTPELPGPFYAYPVSKAAVNMAGAQLARDLAPLGISVILQTPGWVRTDMGGDAADLSVQESVDALLKQADKLTFEDSGRFFEYDGSALDW